MIPITLTIAAATAVGFGVEHRFGELRSQGAANRVMQLMLWILLPPIVFLNIADLHLTAGVGFGVVFGWAGMGAAMFAAYAIGKWLLRLPRTAVGTMMLGAGLGNSGYLGLPFTAALFGFDDVGDAIVFDILVSGMGLLTVGFAIGAAFGTVVEAPRDRVVSFFTRNPALWAGLAGALAPAALSPDWAVDASRVAVFAMLPLGFFVVGVTLAERGRGGRRQVPAARHRPRRGDGGPQAAALSRRRLRPVADLHRHARLLHLPGRDGLRHQHRPDRPRLRHGPLPGGQRGGVVDGCGGGGGVVGGAGVIRRLIV